MLSCLLKQSNKHFKNMDYKEQAENFLKKFNLLLNIREAVPQKSPIWAKDGKHGINYWVTLSENKTGGKSYSFDFWGSIADKENNWRGFAKYPNAYDVLACLNTYDKNVSFGDFCLSYGYNEDSITADKTYKAVMLQIEGLENVLSKEAIEALNDIQ
jgi:hypothetical protein